MSSEPAIVRQSTTELKDNLVNAVMEVQQIKEQLAGRKRKAPEEPTSAPADEVAAKDDTEEKAEEPEESGKRTSEDVEESEEPTKKRMKNNAGEPVAVSDEEDFSDDEVVTDEEDAEMEDIIENGKHIAVAYGNLDGKSKRRWYAATVKDYNEKTGLYLVEWKFPPRTWAKKTTFSCDSSRMKLIEESDYDNAPKRGTGYVGLHRQSTFIIPEKEPASDEESVDDEEALEVGDYVAVAYGASRANKRGADPAARDTKKYHKRFLWYAATVTEKLPGNALRVEWKYPFSGKESDKFFDIEEDKVQAITAKEFKKSKKRAKGKASYGLVGIHRLETKAALTSGN